MALDYSFTGIRLVDGALYPVDWHLTANIIAQLKKSSTKEESEHAANVAYQRMCYWLDINLPEIIVVNVESEDDLYLANLASNITMYCPGPPNDDLIIQLLHSKLSTIAGESLVIGEIHLKASDTTLSYTFDASEGEYDLPVTSKEYYPEGAIIKDEEPWWMRNDGFCFEIIREEEEEKPATSEEYFINVVDPMLEFDKAAAGSSHISITREPAKILQIEKWKPRTI
jgi:hypothetical protein